ncbi:uncharacterized protein LOC100829610 [Brachypodium distachyon]|uniref:Protein XRI1 n=1 Tax=Brachypodium distachyon TaxID=15368 RepID=A0A2K2D1T2_BRADI|nr:uncharacterized protein LOC100829610 [Brachypodium distachyon]PNT68252.1 hypothetical protein BRADI_3g37866v3 [Brachypodium distachyon]|eukprot:XP_003572280.2 uncharacterized protein LOC100829610 [Brachypodium distachyon]
MAHLSSYPHPHNLSPSLSLSRFPTGSLLLLHPMETAQESELQERQQAWWWPLDNMACSSGSLDMSSNGSCFLLELDSQLRYLGLGVVGVAAAAASNPDDHRRTIEHELGLFFPKCMESPASSSEAVQDATVMPEDQLDELLQSFWDAEEEDQQQLIGFSSSSILKENGTFVLDDDDLLASLSSVSPVEPALPEPEQQPPSSSSSSHCNLDPPASETAGAQPQNARARTNCSSKRSATQEDTDAWNGKRSRKAAASCSVARPFTVVKPGPSGMDGVATLADINERILTRPARPVPHPVGEFACVPRASASAGGGDRPAPSGKAVASFTRLHTGAGKGTITIIRTSS